MNPAAGATYVGPIQTGEVMATDNNGVTSCRLYRGDRLKFVTISARPYNFDATIEYNLATEHLHLQR